MVDCKVTSHSSVGLLHIPMKVDPKNKTSCRKQCSNSFGPEEAVVYVPHDCWGHKVVLK